MLSQTLEFTADDALQIMKIQDLLGLANCVLELMVGKFQQTYDTTAAMLSDNLASESNRIKQIILKNVPLDLLPLNWSKVKDVVRILKIIRLLVGPHGRLN